MLPTYEPLLLPTGARAGARPNGRLHVGYVRERSFYGWLQSLNQGHVTCRNAYARIGRATRLGSKLSGSAIGADLNIGPETGQGDTHILTNMAPAIEKRYSEYPHAKNIVDRD